jgi:hypothetical protein
MRTPLSFFLAGAVAVLIAPHFGRAQAGNANPPAPLNWSAEQDHQNMMEQLGTKSLRPGASGKRDATNYQNTNEAKANPFPNLPDPLTLKNGLCNKGQPRKPDDWGALRAWAWGASRALDYFETDPAVDAKQVGLEGVSRYGKATLVAMAYDPRFAIALVGSSGEGGAKLSRRNYGELVENLIGTGEFHWMTGNFLKYGGPLTPGDLPVDAHELIALCAPRPTFISYGATTGPGSEGPWLDQHGSFMAAVAAGPVFRLLGKKDLGTPGNYLTDPMPPLNTGLLDGGLAWRQHDGGHTDAPNWPVFLQWADRSIKRMKAKG